MAVTRSGWQERTQLLPTPPSSSLTSIKHIHITTSGGHAEVLSWASGTVFRNPLSGWSSCTHFFIVFNKDELSLVIDSCFNNYINPRWDLLSTFFISSLTDQSPGPKRGLVVMRRWMEALALSHPVCLVVLPCLAAVDLVHPSIGRYQTKCFVCSFNSAKAGLLDCRARIQSWGVLNLSLRASCAQLGWWSRMNEGRGKGHE